MSDERRYWQEHEFILELLKQIPSHIFWKNRDSIYLGCNDAFAKGLGLSSPDDVIGKSDFELSTKIKECEEYIADDKKVMNSKKPKINIEENQTFPDGRKLSLLTSKVPLLTKEGNVMGVLGVYSDITELKNAKHEVDVLKDALAKANAEKRLFMFIVSTRVKNILMGIETARQLMDQTIQDSDQKEMLSLIKESVSKIQRMFAHVTDFLDIKDDNELEQISIQLLVEAAANDALKQTEYKPFLITVYYDVNFQQYQMLNYHKVSRVLANLISNAVSYTDEGVINISIEYEVSESEEPMLKIVIKDTGCGISKEQLSGLLTLFERSDIDVDYYQSGGVILSLTKLLVDRLGGKINVDSTPEQGTTFTLLLPCRLAEETQSLVQPTKASLKPLLISNNEWFKKSLTPFFNLKKSNIPTINKSDSSEFVKHLKTIQAKHLIIDGSFPVSQLKEFIDSICNEIGDEPYFACIIGPKDISQYETIFPSSWTVISLGQLISHRSFEEEFIQQFLKWKAGKVVEIENMIAKHNIRVLLIEDEYIARKAITLLLKNENCLITAFNSSESAIKAIKNDSRQQYDIVFLDLGLPGKSGIDMARYLRSLSVYKSIPIIAQTAFASEEDNIMCAEAGFTDLIEKPISISSIKNMLNKYMLNKSP